MLFTSIGHHLLKLRLSRQWCRINIFRAAIVFDRKSNGRLREIRTAGIDTIRSDSGRRERWARATGWPPGGWRHARGMQATGGTTTHAEQRVSVSKGSGWSTWQASSWMPNPPRSTATHSGVSGSPDQRRAARKPTARLRRTETLESLQMIWILTTRGRTSTDNGMMTEGKRKNQSASS